MMTNEEAISILTTSIEDSKNNIKFCYDEKGIEALDQAILALELLGHITDRPCSACIYSKENGCARWECGFDKILNKRGESE